MPTFAAPDGTQLAYQVLGSGAPLICLSGGPMRDPVYLGDLGGMSAHRQLILLNPRGTGRSAVPADPASYRCDRQVGDVEALREHLGLDTMDVLTHSAGGNLAALYVTHHPGRVSRLVQVTPSTRAVGVPITGDDRLEIARRRHGEPWFPAAYAALERLAAGQEAEELWDAVAPFFHGRWDTAAQHLWATDAEQSNREAAYAFAAEGAFDVVATRAALARFTSPVLLLVGELDLNSPPKAMTEYAALFPNATLIVQPDAGHYPWLDDPNGFVATASAFLA